MKILLGFILLFCTGRLTAGQCYNSLQDIEVKEQLVQDDQVLRTYILCANTDFQIGSLSSHYGGLLNPNSTMLHLRPNIKIQCGDNGAQSNNCRLVDGDVQLEGTNQFGITHDKRLDSVWVEGLTFVGSHRHWVLVDQPGDIMFLNCNFQDATNSLVPIKLDYYDATGNDSLHVSFKGCSFKRNTFAGFPSQPSIMVGNGSQNRITVADSVFEENDMVVNNGKSDRMSSLIESQGPVDLLRNCFLNNRVGVALVAAFGQTSLQAKDNFEETFSSDTTNRLCPLSAAFATSDSFETLSPDCNSMDAQMCMATADPLPPTRSPTLTPTTHPTRSPTDHPTMSPTTLNPSASPTVRPTTAAPTSVAPTTTTHWPSGFPSDFPSIVPTREPSILVESKEEEGTPAFKEATAISQGTRIMTFWIIAFLNLLY